MTCAFTRAAKRAACTGVQYTRMKERKPKVRLKNIKFLFFDALHLIDYFAVGRAIMDRDDCDA